VNVVVNGEKQVLVADLTVAGLLAELGLTEKKVAIELNQSVLEKSEWAATRLNEDDRLEIVHFVGGG
jgi:thiamine biosynthesis protein ThiS